MNLFCSLISVHVPRFTANERFISFDCPGHLVDRAVVHRVADSMEHEPCGLLGDFKCSRDLIRTNTVLAIGEHPHCAKPLVQPDSAVLKNRADFNRVLLFALSALPHQARFEEGMLLAAASRAYRNAVGPFHRSNLFNACQRVTVVPYRVKQTTMFIEFGAFHTSSIRLEER